MNMDPAMIREYVESASFIVATTIIGITTAQNILYFIHLIVAFIALQGRLLIKTPK